MAEPDHRGDRAQRAVASQADSGGKAGNLMLRVASAAVLVPLALAATYAGGWIFVAICLVAAAGILWEWDSIAVRNADAGGLVPVLLVPGVLGLIAAAVLIGLDQPRAAWVAVAIAAAVAGLAGASRRPFPAGTGGWALAGVLYAGAMLLGAALLRRDPQWGLTALLFLFATVWITDTFAFFGGRSIGGPLLWPRVSPKKTWSGAVCGLAGGVVAGLLLAYASGVGKLGIVGVMALLLSVSAQAGDLLESAVKRRFGAKDASHLIPGHGGFMDRLDGFLVAALVALIVGTLHAGADAPARGLLVW